MYDPSIEITSSWLSENAGLARSHFPAAVLLAAKGMGQTAPADKAAKEAGECCGVAMTLLGEARGYHVIDGKTSSGAPVALENRIEVFGDEMVVKVDLPAGTYTVEVLGSENTFTEKGIRLFDVEAISGVGGAGGAGGAGAKTVIGKDVDLFALGGGSGKGATVKGTVRHGGGTLRLLFTGKRDHAKFSTIRVLDAQGNKVAWLFAEDVVNGMNLPDVPPVVAGPVIWKDASQAMEKRAADLVRRMTLREKVLQMSHTAPAIERLGLLAYNYWSEALHGVARNGKATVFPQAIGMAASFDTDLLHNVADVIATEGRAKFNDWQAKGAKPGTNGGLFRGLTFWSPNINLFRDPRWGRGQETYGEDPMLSGAMAVAFITGLQGDDPKYFKVIATAKHFAVHSGPEVLRHTFNATPPVRDFYESYLPQFETAVRVGKVYSVMGAYNRVYGAPATESDLLLKTLLREQWGFQGYVVSDCWAINDIWANHKVEPDRAAAAAGAVLAGCDLECGENYGSLAAASDLGLIGEGAIDTALERVLLSRFKLGLFDPPAAVKYAGIAASANDTAANGAVALKMARESMVLLKNDGALPLSKGIKKLAVVGPNAEGLLPLLGNYNGTPSRPVTVLAGIKGVAGNGMQVTYVRGADNAEREGAWQIVPDICLRPTGAAADPLETGLKAEFFDNETFAGKPVVTRTEKAIDWRGMVEYMMAGVPTEKGSVRWSGEFVAPADGEYRLTASGSTAHRLTVAGQVVTSQGGWNLNVAARAVGAVQSLPGQIVMNLKAGQSVPVVLECHQSDGAIDLQLLWNTGQLNINITKNVADRVKDCDAIVFVGGLDGHMEAEEGDVRGEFVGFAHGDRAAIEMPATQTAMLKALVATGKPVVLVNMSGSAMAMLWEAGHVNAIVQAWYPGQAGQAVAEVLFGDINPAGRLPVTFYNGTGDLPEFTEYAMGAEGSSKGRTYRYFTGKPLWAFGEGLSYTTFRYGEVKVEKEELVAADVMKVGVDVTNSGARDGEEVVQVYARAVKPGAGDALQRLIGFKRVAIAAGKTVHVEVASPVMALRNWDEGKKAYVVPAGRYEVRVGASSADVRGVKEIAVK